MGTREGGWDEVRAAGERGIHKQVALGPGELGGEGAGCVEKGKIRWSATEEGLTQSFI